jgi:murein hydrolase activator
MIRSRHLFRLFLAFAFLQVAAISGENKDELEKHRADLQAIREQIRLYEQRVQEQQAQEVSTLELLDTFDQKGTLLRTLLRKLHSEEQGIQQRIEGIRNEIQKLEDQLAFLKSHYAQYVTSVYKSGRTQDLELLLTAQSVNQFYVRTEYLRRFSEQRRQDVLRIASKKREIQEKQNRLQIQLGEERRLIAEKASEEDRLVMLVSDRRDVLHQIRKDRRLMQQELVRQRRAAKKLETLIERLVEAERVRKAREAEDVEKGILPVPPPVVEGAFEARKGSLRWPVSAGSIVARFGNQVHPTLRTVTQNTGIDINVNPGSPVNTVADGEVSLITWLPSYGNVVIINHYNGYRTVSTHLSQIYVVEGQRLREGDPIGESGESVDGPRLHFEIWKDREKQNPELWLSRQ